MEKKRRGFGIFILLTWTACQGSVSAAGNLLANGGFEKPALGSGTSSGYVVLNPSTNAPRGVVTLGSTIPGWDILENVRIANSQLLWGSPAEGTQSLALSGFPGDKPGGVSQKFNAKDGNEYLLSFLMGGDYLCFQNSSNVSGPTVKNMTVSISGTNGTPMVQKWYSFEALDGVSGIIPWTKYTMAFTASTPDPSIQAMVLSFVSTTKNADGCGPIIDDVRLIDQTSGLSWKKLGILAAGGAIAFVLVVLVVWCLCWCFCCRFQKRSHQDKMALLAKQKATTPSLNPSNPPPTNVTGGPAAGKAAKSPPLIQASKTGAPAPTNGLVPMNPKARSEKISMPPARAPTPIPPPPAKKEVPPAPRRTEGEPMSTQFTMRLERLRNAHVETASKEFPVPPPPTVLATVPKVMSKVGGAHVFALRELEEATRGWSQPIGESVAGRKVYHGQLPDGKEIVVKRRASEGRLTDPPDFNKEVEVLAKLHHRHVAELVGVCRDRSLMLVFEFMPNGSLYDRLHGNRKDQVLSWSERLSIALGAARGIDYLHSESDTPLLHRNIMSSNILLDSKLNARVADMATWKSESLVNKGAVNMATGYWDPKCAHPGQFTDKCDTYAFGIVLLEILSGEPPIDEDDPKSNWTILRWAKPLLEDGKLDEVVDPKILATCSMDAAWQLAAIAIDCCGDFPNERPSMADVVQGLRDAVNMQIPDDSIRRTGSEEGGSRTSLLSSLRGDSERSVYQQAAVDGRLSLNDRFGRPPAGGGRGNESGYDERPLNDQGQSWGDGSGRRGNWEVPGRGYGV